VTDDKRVRVEREGRVMIVSLNRPEGLNALSVALLGDLADAYDEFRQDPEVWVAIIMGKGRCFSAGRDVKEMLAPPDAERRRAWQRLQVQGAEQGFLTNCDKPIIAAVHRYCMGGGLSIALSCDLIVAAEGTQFAVSEAKRGLPPTAVLARTFASLPHKLAMQMNLTGDPISAEQALQFGMINQIVPEADLRESAMRLAQRILAAAPLAVRAAKKKAWMVTGLGLEAALRLDVGQAARESEDLQEGLQAFREKRLPRWQGR
jgi:enoyl-CoA hydratase/carnithine racemase